ncbi:MAG: hypothetical protein A2Z02_02725 [Chloroflexi bacterium RBG_16_48_7]|nr:MAG: hypothetical protein A2Z02_02725 [Chloroflexi bacterium RBG_16_48_7]
MAPADESAPGPCKRRPRRNGGQTFPASKNISFITVPITGIIFVDDFRTLMSNIISYVVNIDHVDLLRLFIYYSLDRALQEIEYA